MSGVVGIALAAAALLVGAAAAQQNVLLILADDVGVDSVRCYQEGNDLPATPNLDALAAGGILFRNAYAYPSCSPTRSALLTGRHPTRTLVGRWISDQQNTTPPIGVLQAREHTLPELLGRAGTGHATACIGKWHLHDATHTLDRARVFGGFGHHAGFLVGQLPDYFTWPRVVAGVSAACGVYATTQQVDDAIAWIGQQAQPWFCYLAFTAPHLPFHVPPATLHSRVLTAASSNREKYLAAIESLDREIGRLFAALGPARLAATHVLFLGDNGSIQNMAVAPFLGARAKGTPYEGGVNVPLLYKGPAAAQPGRQVGALACAVDVFATVLDLLGAAGSVPPWLAVDGVSLAPLLTNPNAGPVRPFAWSEEFTGAVWPAPNANGHAIVRDAQHKLIHRYGGAHELYDLIADPWESTNLLAAPLTPVRQQAYNALLAEVSRMRTPYARWQTFGGSQCLGSAGVPTTACSAPPRLGTTVQAQLAGAAPGVFALVGVGFDHVQQSGVPLPLDLASFGGGQGCKQWFAVDATFATVTTAAGASTWALAIPNAPALVETTPFLGHFVLDPQAPGNALGIVTTRPVAAVLGL